MMIDADHVHRGGCAYRLAWGVASVGLWVMVVVIMDLGRDIGTEVVRETPEQDARVLKAWKEFPPWFEHVLGRQWETSQDKKRRFDPRLVKVKLLPVSVSLEYKKEYVQTFWEWVTSAPYPSGTQWFLFACFPLTNRSRPVEGSSYMSKAKGWIIPELLLHREVYKCVFSVNDQTNKGPDGDYVIHEDVLDLRKRQDSQVPVKLRFLYTWSCLGRLPAWGDALVSAINFRAKSVDCWRGRPLCIRLFNRSMACGLR